MELEQNLWGGIITISMKQYGAVIKVMEQNGGFATLGYLYREALKVSDIEWKTKTPFASIRRIVQDERFFFKIKPGLWALNSFKNELPINILPEKSLPKSKKKEFDHTYYQGLLVEIGNLKKYRTFIPYQDKNKDFLGKKLANTAIVKEFYNFSYPHIVNTARTIDVTWFNSRKMPSRFFEVEYSTDMRNSLLKFVELQDFYVEFFIVADIARQKEFAHKVILNAFQAIQNRIKFLNYDQLSEWHTKTCEFISLEKEIAI